MWAFVSSHARQVIPNATSGGARAEGRRLFNTALAAALTGVLLAGCTSSTQDTPSVTGERENNSSVAASSTGQGADGEASSDTSSGSTPTPSPLSATTLSLSTTGLALVDDSMTRELTFGSDRETVELVLSEKLGEVTVSEQPECGQGPRTMLEAGGLAILFEGPVFMGWHLSQDNVTTEMVDGVRIGSTLAQVEANHDVSVTEDSLGPEFFSRDGEFGGFLDAASPDARVIGLHAGETCYFR